MLGNEFTTFTAGEYYEGHFDSQAYVKNFYSCPAEEKNFLAFVLRCLSRIFSAGEHKGKLLVDVGSGPSIHSLECRIEKWLKSQKDGLDWKPMFPSDLEATLKQQAKKVLKCDVRLDNPFYPHTLEPADCVITSLCLEAVCKDIQTYCLALHGLSKLMRPGGLLVMIGVLGESFYKVDEQLFSCLGLSRDNIEEGFCCCSFHPSLFRQSSSVTNVVNIPVATRKKTKVLFKINPERKTISFIF
uniref:Zgc:64002 n=1 Tax=Cyprinus carpio TaxID=7962 RepID=A0A8C2ACS3_CYPCA